MGIKSINREGKVVIDKPFLYAERFSEGLACVQTPNRLYGYIDKTGNFVSEPKFISAQSFSEGLAVVQIRARQNFKEVCIDKTGKIVIDNDFTRMYRFSEGLALAEKGDDIYVVEKTGESTFLLNTEDDYISFIFGPYFSNGVIAVFKTDIEKGGFIDRTGKFAIEPKFLMVAPFSEGLARASIKVDEIEKQGFIDISGKFVIEPKFPIDDEFVTDGSEFSEGLAGLVTFPEGVDEPKFMFIDRTGEIVFVTDSFGAGSFHNGIADVWDADPQKCGYVDKSGKFFPLSQKEFAYDFYEDLALITE